MLAPDATDRIERHLARLRAGDDAARHDLIAHVLDHLFRLSRRLLRGSFERVRRWEETLDVCQNAALRLFAALEGRVPESPLHFYRFAALAMRRELIDLARRHFGPHGIGANYDSAEVVPGTTERPAFEAPDPADGPPRLAEWTEFHHAAQNLPDDEAAVVDLLYYQELSQEAAARLLGVDVRTVQRRWRTARLKLHALLHDD